MQHALLHLFRRFGLLCALCMAAFLLPHFLHPVVDMLPENPCGLVHMDHGSELEQHDEHHFATSFPLYVSVAFPRQSSLVPRQPSPHPVGLAFRLERPPRALRAV